MTQARPLGTPGTDWSVSSRTDTRATRTRSAQPRSRDAQLTGPSRTPRTSRATSSASVHSARAARSRGAATDARAGHAPRVPFAVLVLSLVVGGMALLLVLNTASAANELDRRGLATQDAGVAAQVEQLRNEVAASAAPANLARAAQNLGMVPAANPAFLVIAPDGSVVLRGQAAPVEPDAVPVPPAAKTPARSTPAKPTATNTTAAKSTVEPKPATAKSAADTKHTSAPRTATSTKAASVGGNR